EKFQMIAGERRYRASIIAGLQKVPVIKKDYNQQQKDEIALIENLQRKDLNPIEEAKAYKSLIEKYGFTQDALADKLGKSRPAITNALRLLNLSPAVVDMVQKERLSAGHARCLAGIKDNPAVQASYALAAANKGMSVRQLEVMVYNYLNPQEVKKVAPVVLTPEIKTLVNNMQHIFGTKIKAVGNNEKGRIFIDYYTPSDLNRIYEMIDKLNIVKKM
ncbi:MAG: ParB/RepB/Spo0J family partition protein, partial [Clostridia bacterium]